jgi:putative inorganic carbon (hco3(-)) transporter
MTTTFFNPMLSEADASPHAGGLPRRAAFVGLALTVVAVQFSIAVGEILLAFALIAWAAMLVVERRRPSAPSWMLPLLLYAGWTFVSAAFSPDLRASLSECKQLVLLLLIPLTYDVVDEGSAVVLTTIIVSAAACSAVVGIGQYSILHYDNLGQRPRSTLGLYMTFSGLMMLALNVALSRVLFMTRSRMWPALVIPALVVALSLSLSRNDWLGACCAVALLLILRDFRLTAALPVAVALFFAVAPSAVLHRFYSIFDPQDPTIRDRFAMMRAGVRIIKAYPITGVGPNMIARVYPRFRDSGAVLNTPPHLHNVPLQIAAERGLPAVGVWIWFVVAVVVGAIALFRTAPREGPVRFLAATALASVVAMLGAGMFEHNFGDSEFQILFLVLITLPFAVARTRRDRTTAR